MTDVNVVQAPSRRARIRAATSQEIVQTARRLLVEQGIAAVSLRAIAREMGMTAPALYRYYDSHEELIRHVVADIFTELTGYLHAAIHAAADASNGTSDLLAVKMIASCRAFREWALLHQPEFGMIFGSPLPGVDLDHTDPLNECGFRFGQIFLDLFSELWRRRPFPAPDAAELDPSLRRQLAHYHALIGGDLPLGVLQTFLRCWVLLYGTVSLEVFGHLRFALDDATPLFELILADLAAIIGLKYPPPN